MSKRKLPGEPAWAWECDFGLCAWAEPSQYQLTRRSQPSPEAKPVMVRLIKESELRKLIKAAKGNDG